MKILSISAILLFLSVQGIRSLNGVWRWECKEGYCQKTEITPETEETASSLAACRIFCSDHAALWPKPTGNVTIENFLLKLNLNSIELSGKTNTPSSQNYLSLIFKNFHNQILKRSSTITAGGKTVEIYFEIANPNIQKLSLDTDEAYTLNVSETSDGLRINATITADNIFGARHGLETLNQLMVYDDLRDEILIPRKAFVSDKPAYPYRGILLDTSRNYVSVDVIKRTLDGMGASKLNSFHWHITDSHSFPYVAPNLPDLSKYGAYSPNKVYSPEVVAEIVKYGLAKGVRVVPEFDAPAHVGEGWQKTDFVVCFNAKPWQDFCVEPPCGQFDPTKPKLYDTLEVLYGDMLDQFQPDIFHMGGDEVQFSCWNSTNSIVEWMKAKNWGRSEADFVKLWDMFQNESVSRLYKKAGKEIPVVLWTSTLTQKENLQFLPKDKYIIQVWTTGTDPQISNLLENGYRLILSNYDALYFDCGFAGWVQGGNNWCSPYIGWQTVYGNTPAKIAGGKKGQILGSESVLWTEQADSASVDTRLWPRAAATAEVLWSEPAENSWRDAEQRFLVQRERLIELGINADAIEPQWCMQYEENCPTNDQDFVVAGDTMNCAIPLVLIISILISSRF